jgi:hypothetical protein
LAGVQNDCGDQIGIDPRAQSPNPGQVRTVDAGSGLDLERDDSAVVAFEDQVDLVTRLPPLQLAGSGRFLG